MYVFLFNIYILIFCTIVELKNHYDILGKFGCKHLKVQGLGAALSPSGSAVSCSRAGDRAGGIQAQKL